MPHPKQLSGAVDGGSLNSTTPLFVLAGATGELEAVAGDVAVRLCGPDVHAVHTTITTTAATHLTRPDTLGVDSRMSSLLV